MSGRWIRRRSVAEVRLRLAQLVAVLAERVGYVRDGDASDYVSPRLPFSPLEPEAFRARWPQEAAERIARADRAIEGRLDLLGFKELELGRPIDWHLDPISGKRAPRVHWSRVPYLDADVVGDHKVVWELNRHQHFVTMGQAYWLTGDERYARAFVAQLESWIEANPPKIGINWASSLEIALRSVSWIWALRLFESSPSMSAEWKERALRLLDTNARHLETYLSTYFSPNTHLTGEALGLLYIGTAFPLLSRASEWRALGTSILTEEIQKQIRADGVYFEQSAWYQAYTVDFYLHAMLLSGQAFPSEVSERMESACDVLHHITRPDGSIPRIGDDDGGRLLPLQSSGDGDYRDLLGLASVILQRPDYSIGLETPPPSLAWLLGRDGLLRYESMGLRRPDGFSKGFPEGGWFSLRDGWTETATQMVVNVGPRSRERGAHAHADALSIELTVEGQPMLSDPGTYTYMGPERDFFRSTAAHNTMTVNNNDSSLPDGRFRWKRAACSRVANWVSTPTFDYLEAWHDGYSENPDAVVHRRAVLWLKGRYWIVLDRIEGKPTKSIALRFHAAPRVTALLETSARATLRHERSDRSSADVFLSILSTGGNGTYRLEDSWVSPTYGKRVRAPALTYELLDKDEQDVSIVTALVPQASSSTYLALDENHAERGRSWTLEQEEFDDLLLLGGDNGSRTRGIVSTAGLCWVRRTEAQALELVAVGPGSIDVDGARLEWTSGWAHGRRVGDEWRLETV